MIINALTIILFTFQMFLVGLAVRNWRQSKRHLAKARRLLEQHRERDARARETADETLNRIIYEHYVLHEHRLN